ncbi:MAG: alanine/glycine:cation symporter family protein [Rikenellaceae bacterium]
MEYLISIAQSVNGVLWSYILIAMLLGCAIYFTLRSRFVQFRMLPDMIRTMGESTSNGRAKQISSFQAFTVSLASRVGSGNLAGVAIAISVGGAGAVFWMWVVAILGAASSFVESTLSQLYKRRNGESFIGGPAYYMESGLGVRWMGVIFAILISITFGLAFNSVQSNTIHGALDLSFGVDRVWVGVVLSIITVIIIFGGIHRIAKFSSVVVPIMAVGYLLLALFVVGLNISSIPSLIRDIVGSAFGWREGFAGAVGVAINEGVKRGLFSNEAGMGSAPNAAATASVSHPVKQGLIQTLGVFVDTLLICSSTAMIILLSDSGVNSELSGIQITQSALISEIGAVGGYFITVAIILFAFSSIVGNYYYGEANIRFITQCGWVLTLYRVMVGGMVFIGALASLSDVIIFADLMMGLMTICNLIAITLLGRKAMLLLRDYRSQLKRGVKSPTFVKSSIPELDNDSIECW